MFNYPSNLTEAQFQLVAQYLPFVKKTKPRKWSYHQLLNAIRYVHKTGCQWRQLPGDFPPWKTVYHYFRIWNLGKTWDRMLLELNKLVRKKIHHQSPVPGVLVVDSQSVKTSDMGRKQYIGYDGNKLVKGIKRHLLVDQLGLI